MYVYQLINWKSILRDTYSVRIQNGYKIIIKGQIILDRLKSED